ncbi:MAG: MFS transporter [Gammaproteobacteria bacterium]|nr:MFS transporter [Gammaproteobacteria bacterium]MCZ6578384.1 MFS transporter [Gammaproteobacteria bacterium]
MQRSHLRFLFLNVGHFITHFFVLIFATVAALRLTTEWGMTYAELIPYATPAFVAFGLFAIPAGWLADKWSREGMMAIFFVGIGASSVVSSFASSPLEISFCLTLIGLFAAIYHPVGLAMVVQGREKMGVPLAINGIFGNMGVASAALVTGLLIDSSGWRSAFVIPGFTAIVLGMLYLAFESTGDKQEWVEVAFANDQVRPVGVSRNILIRVFGVIFFTTAVGGIIFQSTTFSLPRVFDERLSDIAGSASLVGLYTFLVFAVAAFAQLVVGYLIDHGSIRTVFAWVAILQTLFFTVMIQLTGLPALIVAIAFMFVVFGEIPINDVLVGRMASSEWRSRAYGITYIIGFTMSAAALPMIAWIHGSWGFDALFAVLAILALVIFIAVLFLPKNGRVFQI